MEILVLKKYIWDKVITWAWQQIGNDKIESVNLKANQEIISEEHREKKDSEKDMVPVPLRKYQEV